MSNLLNKAYDRAFKEASIKGEMVAYKPTISEDTQQWANETWLAMDNEEKARIQKMLEEAGL